MPTVTETRGRAREWVSEAPSPRLVLEEKPVEINLIHELGREGTGCVHERVAVIEPSTTPTTVRIRFEVVGDTKRSLGSPTYRATVRRRKCAAIARAVSELERHSGRDDFTTYTFSVIEQLKALLADIDNAEKEGNTRAILRQLRNTFLDHGWENYRKPEPRRSAIAILEQLANAEEVAPADVKNSFTQLTRNNLNTVGLPLPAYDDEEDEQQDGEEEEEVPD